MGTYFLPRELPLVESNQASICASRGPGDRQTSAVGEQKTSGPGDRRTRIPGDQRTTGPEDQETGGLGDQWTKGPRDQGTKGPVDQRTKGPKDQGTTLPEDPQTTRPGEQQKRPIKEYFFDSLFNFLLILFLFLLMLFLFFFDTYALGKCIVMQSVSIPRICGRRFQLLRLYNHVPPTSQFQVHRLLFSRIFSGMQWPWNRSNNDIVI